MSYVNLTNVEIVQPHVAPFLSPIAVDIVLDCSQPLKAGLFLTFWFAVFFFLIFGLKMDNRS